MEIIRTEKTIVEEVITYKAADGTTFKDQEECKRYEESAKCVINARYKEILKKEFDSYCLIEGDWHYYDVVEIKNEDDLKAANMYMKANYSEVTGLLTTADIGKDILIQTSDDGYYAEPCGTIEDIISRIRKNYSKAMNEEEQ